MTAKPSADGRPDESLGLTYPCGTPPESGHGREIVPGVHWLRMPLPWALDAHQPLGIGRRRAAGRSSTPAAQTREALADWTRALAAEDALDGQARHARVRHPHASRPRRHGRLADAQVRRAAVDDAARIPHLPHRWWPTPAARRRTTACASTARRLGRRGDRELPRALRRLRQARSTRCPTASAACATATRSRIGGHDWRVDRRQRPFARARLPVLRRTEAAHLRRPGAAAHLVQRVGVPDRARGRSAGRLDRLAGQAASARCPTTCWCCRRTTSRSAACTRGSTTLTRGHEQRLTRLRRALAEPKRAVDVFGALFARPIDEARSCSAWPPARAWPT